MFFEREIRLNNNLVLKKYKNIKCIKLYNKLINLEIIKEISNSKLELNNFENINLIPNNISNLIKNDVERCVIDDDNKCILNNVLSYIYINNKNYNQGLSYIATILLSLTDDIKYTINLLLYITNNLFDRNIWTLELNGLYEEIYVIKNLLKLETKEIMNSINLNMLFFIQKYIFTLFINIFDSDNLLLYLYNIFNFKNYHYYVITYIIDNIINNISKIKDYQYLTMDIILNKFSIINNDLQIKSLDLTYNNYSINEQYIIELRNIEKTRVNELLQNIKLQNEINNSDSSIYLSDDEIDNSDSISGFTDDE